MKKRYIAMLGVGIAGYFFRNEQNRHKLKSKVKNAAAKIRNGDNDDHDDVTLEDAGAPDQIEPKDPAQLENSKMVSEGSQFGVAYYNQVKEEANETMNQ